MFIKSITPMSNYWTIFFMFKDAIEKVQPPENTLILATNEPADLYFFVEL